MSQIQADTLNSVIDFDSPFTVAPGGNVFQPLFGIYAPAVTHSESADVEIDSPEWESFSIGYTGQYGYNGAVMHASETLSGALARDILSTPGTYVVCAVESVPCYDDPTSDPCFPDEPEYCETYGCECDPAGWIVLTYSANSQD